MAERETAEDRLARILAILPRAARAGGVPLRELARDLQITEREVVRALEEVYTREYYHAAGSGEDVQVTIANDEVEVFTTGEFRRPPRLSPREMLALGLGLRVLAVESTPARRAMLVRLAERLEAGVIGSASDRMLEGIAVNPGADSPEGARGRLVEAARERRRCRIEYLKPSASAPEVRLIDPYVLVAAAGQWYLIAYCHRSRDRRVFRADRVVAVTAGEERFDPPDGFDPAAYIREGRVYRPGETVEAVDVVVRYSARVARWIEEQGPVERADDGSVTVRYQVTDPGWLARTVLEYGAEAEVLAPPEMRAHLRGVLQAFTREASERLRHREED